MFPHNKRMIKKYEKGSGYVTISYMNKKTGIPKNRIKKYLEQMIEFGIVHSFINPINKKRLYTLKVSLEEKDYEGFNDKWEMLIDKKGIKDYNYKLVSKEIFNGLLR